MTFFRVKIHTMPKLFIVSENVKYREEALLKLAAKKNACEFETLNLTSLLQDQSSLTKDSVVYLQIPYTNNSLLEADRFLLVKKLIGKKIKVLNSQSFLKFPFENKLVQKYVFSKNKVPTPKYFLFYNLVELLKKIEELPFPLVAKRKAGSKGIDLRIIQDKSELINFFSSHLLTDFFLEKAIPVENYHKVYIINKKAHLEDSKTFHSIFTKREENYDKSEIINLGLKTSLAYKTDFCSVDILNYNGKLYVLEINRNAPSIPNSEHFLNMFFKELRELCILPA